MERLGVAAALALQVVDLAAVTVVALVVGHLRTLTWCEQNLNGTVSGVMSDAVHLLSGLLSICHQMTPGMEDGIGLTHPVLAEFVGANGGWISATLHVEALFPLVADLFGTK